MSEKTLLNELVRNYYSDGTKERLLEYHRSCCLEYFEFLTRDFGHSRSVTPPVRLLIFLVRSVFLMIY